MADHISITPIGDDTGIAKRVLMMMDEEEFFDIDDIRELVRKGNVVWRDHAMKRLRERKISKDDVRNAIYTGDIIEDRPVIFQHLVA